MPLTLSRRRTTAARVRAALLLRKRIDELERRFARTVANLPKNILARNVYGFSAAEMRKIAHNLHAKAKEEIASGRAKKFRGSIMLAVGDSLNYEAPECRTCFCRYRQAPRLLAER